MRLSTIYLAELLHIDLRPFDHLDIFIAIFFILVANLQAVKYFLISLICVPLLVKILILS